MRRFWLWGLVGQILVVALISTLAYAGVLPTSIRAVPHLDWLGHFVLIGLLAFFLDGVLGHRPIARAVPWLRVAPLLVLAIAGVEECAQALSPRRSSSVLDFVADAAGVFFFAWLSSRVERQLVVRRERSCEGLTSYSLPQ